MLSKKKVSKVYEVEEEEEEVEKTYKSIPLFDKKLLAFTFRDKEIKKGVYRIPFSFNLPTGIPGSFKFSQFNPKKSMLSEKITIEYYVEVYIEIPNSKTKRYHKIAHRREIEVREYLFTDEEIEEDWKKYQNIIDIRKVLRPNTILASRPNKQYKKLAQSSFNQ